MNWMDWILALSALLLIGAEGFAILNKTPGDTISERTRVYFRIKREANSKAGAFIFIVFVSSVVGWFLVHIVGNAGVVV